MELGATWFSDLHLNLLSSFNELGLNKYPQFSEGTLLFQTKSFEPPQKFFVPKSEVPSYKLENSTLTVFFFRSQFFITGIRSYLSLKPYFDAVVTELKSISMQVSIREKNKKEKSIALVFLKSETEWKEQILEDTVLKVHFLKSFSDDFKYFLVCNFKSSALIN